MSENHLLGNREKEKNSWSSDIGALRLHSPREHREDVNTGRSQAWKEQLWWESVKSIDEFMVVQSELTKSMVGARNPEVSCTEPI